MKLTNGIKRHKHTCAMRYRAEFPTYIWVNCVTPGLTFSHRIPAKVFCFCLRPVGKCFVVVVVLMRNIQYPGLTRFPTYSMSNIAFPLCGISNTECCRSNRTSQCRIHLKQEQHNRRTANVIFILTQSAPFFKSKNKLVYTNKPKYELECYRLFLHKEIR